MEKEKENINSEFVESKAGKIAVSDDLKIRKEKILKFLKAKRDWVYYILLGIITFLGVWIRTRNISGLKDVTTGTWTLGPDLDPFLFLRWAEYIVEHGKLFAFDAMRYVPLSEICSGAQCNPINTALEMRLLPYMIAWFHKFLSVFVQNLSVTYSAILFPVVMFALTTIAFFLFARKIFYKQNKNVKNIIALASTALFVTIPSLLPRTIAGIPEKESAAFFFLFIALYFFLEAFTSEKLKKGLVFGIFAGIMTACMALIWGGAGYIFITISAAVLFAFILGKIDKNKFYIFSAWLASFVLLVIPFSIRYTFVTLISSISTGIMFVVFFILLVDFLVFRKKIIKIPEKIRRKIPDRIISILISMIILGLLTTIIFGGDFIPSKIKDFISSTVHPLDIGRFSSTVAENSQPYFVSDWMNEFGPVQWGIPLFFWLFFIGSTFLFGSMIKSLSKKERRILTFGYILFLLGLVFSKYSASSILNGDNAISFIIYFGGILFFLGFFIYFYCKRYKKGELDVFKDFDFSYILYFIVMTMAIMGARGAIRLIMVLGAVSPIAVGFLAVMVVKKYPRKGEDMKKLIMAIVIGIILLASIFTFWIYANQSRLVAESYAPGTYQQQWQRAMAWVRENTPVTAVFAHWWDYGYWLQSIGERATVLDGGNGVAYWNHLMGRLVLTGTNENDALDFLYAHNTTHLLIDSTEIGKYGAYSSIGSDENYDRFAWVSTFLVDDSQTQETNSETIYVYKGGSYLDDDLVIEENGKEILLPRKNAIVGALVVRITSQGILQPEVVYIYNNQQYFQKLRYAYFEGEVHDFGSGVDAGIFLYPKVNIDSKGVYSNPVGAAFYLGERVIHTQFVNLYLFGKESDYFKVAHIESDPFVEDLRSQGIEIGEFVDYNGFRGPIKIWEINYPSGIQLNEDYLSTDYPEELQKTIPGEYK